MFVEDPAGAIAFLRQVFHATGEIEADRPAEIAIGDSLMLVSGPLERGVHTVFLYVYVDDADETYARAVAAGAETIEAPLDTPYGHRRATVRDPMGNIFQIATPQ